jgi:murein DD-endopeptidase MepM/ murein hydrolase activator NlpD
MGFAFSSVLAIKSRASMRLGRLALLLVLVTVLIAAVDAPLRAQSNSDRQNELKEEIEEISAEEAAAQKLLVEIRARKAEIDARVAHLDAQLADAVRKVALLEAEVARLGILLQEAQAKLAATQAQLDAAKEEVRNSAAQVYRSARRGATFDYLTLERPVDLVNGKKYLEQVNARQRQTMQRITVLRDDVAVYRQAVANSKAQSDVAAAEAQRARDDIARTRSEIEPARVEAAAQAEAESAQVAALAAKKQQAEHELQAVSAAIAEELRRASISSAGPVPPGSGTAGACEARPTTGAVTSGFGPRRGRLHAGVDIPAPTGTPIYACWSGRVVIAGWQGGYGNAVVIDHGGGKATLYGHQSRIAVSPGQTVGAGAGIGYVGSTGNSTGPHLHFEVRINGDPVNPAPYI